MPLLSSFRRLGAMGTDGRLSLPPPTTELTGERVRLRLGKPLDWQDWRNERERSRAFLTPWEPHWPGDALTFDFFSGNLRRQWSDWKENRGFAFLVFLKTQGEAPVAFDSFGQRGEKIEALKEKEQLVGGVAISHIERGSAQKGRLGYWISQPYARKGLMTEAANLALSFAFEKLELHRMEASCMPANIASRALLAKLGFTQEGEAKGYLRINGAWEDHLLFGKINPAK